MNFVDFVRISQSDLRGQPSQSVHRTLHRLLQHRQTPLQPESAHARSGILQPPAKIAGSLNRKTVLPLRKQQKLSEQPEPPHYSSTCAELPVPTTAHSAARHPSSKEDSTTCPVIRSCAITFQLPFWSLTANGTRSTCGVVLTNTLRAYRL